MIQLVSYNFSTVESPLSNGGNFTIISDVDLTGSLQAIAGNKCEPTAINAPAGAFWSGTVPTTVTWPNDQYSEITVASAAAANTSFCYLIVRQKAFNSGTQYLQNIALDTNGTSTVTLFAVVAGTAHTLKTTTNFPVANNDVFRLTAAGNVITLARNGTAVAGYPITDTNNYITSGSPGFGCDGVAAITASQVSLWAAGATIPGGGSTSWLTVALANSLRGVRH